MTETLNSTVNCAEKIKFLYSYGGKIVPRRPDGVLRYAGGHTRVLSVHRSITFAELMVKFGEACGSSMNLTCNLPSGDLDLLISVKSEDDLRNVIEEYDRVPSEMKIRAVLSPMKVKKASAPSSPMSCFDFPSAPKAHRKTVPPPPPLPVVYCSVPRHPAVHHCCAPAVRYPVAELKRRGYERMTILSHLHDALHRNHPHPR